MLLYKVLSENEDPMSLLREVDEDIGECTGLARVIFVWCKYLYCERSRPLFVRMTSIPKKKFKFPKSLIGKSQDNVAISWDNTSLLVPVSIMSSM
jgi:hypothetical protein